MCFLLIIHKKHKQSIHFKKSAFLKIKKKAIHKFSKVYVNELFVWVYFYFSLII